MATPTTVPELLAVAATHDGAIAVRLGPAELTYAELERRSSALAANLLARGVGKGTRVGLLLPNGPEWVIWWAALSRIGALVVPLSTMAKGPELARVAAHADLGWLVMSRDVLGRDFVVELEEAFDGLVGSGPTLHLASLPYLRHAVVIGDDSPSWARGDAWVAELDVPDEVRIAAEAAVHPTDLALVIYTSGQSADPKGVTHRHSTVAGKPADLGPRFGFTAGMEIHNTMPFFWVGGLVMALLPGLLVGATVVCQERAGWAPPALIGGGSGNANPFGDRGPFPGMGMTETFGFYAWGNDWRLPGYEIAPPLDVLESGYDVKVVDDELLVRGPTVTPGLVKVDRSLNFDADGFYRTGDGGAVVDGRLVFTGRRGDMIKTSGANVSPAEVERELCQIDGLANAFVVAVDDAERGQAVGAALIPEDGVELDVDAVLASLRNRLASYKVPRRVVVLELEDVPATHSQKVDKRALAALIAAGT